VNYYETFIEVAPDCPVSEAAVPAIKGRAKTVAVLQYELLSESPYTFTQEELLFQVHVRRQGMSDEEAQAQRAEMWELLFGKPHACLRTSPLPKQYGWGLHFDAEGKIGLYAVESEEYRAFASGKRGAVHVLKALRSSRA
jgi:hypothetical protein